MKKVLSIVLCFVMATSLHCSSYVNAFRSKVAIWASSVIDLNSATIKEAYAAQSEIKAIPSVDLTRNHEDNVEKCIIALGYSKTEGQSALAYVHNLYTDLGAVVSRSENYFYSWNNAKELSQAAQDVATEYARAEEMKAYLEENRFVYSVWLLLQLFDYAEQVNLKSEQDLSLFIKSCYLGSIKYTPPVYSKNMNNRPYELFFKTEFFLKDMDFLQEFLSYGVHEELYPETFLSAQNIMSRLYAIKEAVLQLQEYKDGQQFFEEDQKMRFEEQRLRKDAEEKRNLLLLQSYMERRPVYVVNRVEMNQVNNTI